ncbi:MAG: hypothetical protein K8U03_20205 [Planctomycetia bacterium]|nr:hypothetical protein [Planctomycetia bacterium]
MNADESTDDLGPAVRVMQIILVALAMGIVMFGAFLCFQQAPDFSDLEVKGMFSWMTLAMGAFGIVLSRVVPRFLPSEGTLGPDVVAKPGNAGLRQRFISGMQIKMIVGAAICEGMAFTNLAAYMLEHSVPCLGMALVLLLAVLLLFPTKNSVAMKLEELERAARENAQWK